ncbi:MAG TPA: hypothetical protein VFV86_06360 [Nitrososphaeraceae archaeon]|nr:hypothetical protein [Nitrososphaeraceae archaeon]
MPTYGIPVNEELHIPISWCSIKGSPAANDPSTDGVLLTNIRLATDNIYSTQAGIFFDSSLGMSSSDRTTFPKLDDVTIRTGGIEQEGDVFRDSSGNKELIDLKNRCNFVWSEDSAGNLVPINGIIALNLNRLVDEKGGIFKNGGSQVIGESLCYRTGPATNPCDIPYGGYVSIIDNYYTSNGIGDLNVDILNQNLAHELGHALGAQDLDSSTAIMNLMYWYQHPNSSGMVDNTQIGLVQKDGFWHNGKQIPGSYVVFTIPVSKIISINPWLKFVIVDHFDENNPDPKSDISSIDVNVNTNSSSFTFDINFDTVLSQNDTNNVDYDYWLLVNQDNNTISQNFTRLINSTFRANNITALLDSEGKEAIHIKSIKVDKGNISKFIGTVWNTKDSNSSTNLIPTNISQINLSHLYLNSHPSSFDTSFTNSTEYPIASSITIALNNSSFIDPFIPFSVQAMSIHDGKIIDVVNPRVINITSDHLPLSVMGQFNQRLSNVTAN